MKHLLLLFFLLLGFSALVQAQPSQVPRCFKAFDDGGREVEVFCVGKEITFRDCSVEGGQPGVEADKEYYDYDSSNGVDFTESANIKRTHTYTRPGKYTVTQFARDINGVDARFEREFTVVENPSPVFTVTSCANKAVSVNITDQVYNAYTLDYGNGVVREVAAGEQPSYTYASDGPYRVTVTGKYNNGFCSNSLAQTVNPLQAVATPVIKTLTVTNEAANGSLTLALGSLQPGIQYVVDRYQDQRINFVEVHTFTVSAAGDATVTVPTVNTAEATLYWVRAYDACKNPVASTRIESSITLRAETNQQQVTLTWRHSPTLRDQVELYRNNTLIKTFDRTVTSYVDEDVQCGQNLSYYVRRVSADGLTSSVSATKEVSIVSTIAPTPAYLLASYNTNNQVELTIQPPQGIAIKQIDYERSTAGPAYTVFETGQNVNITDPATELIPTCYRATYVNICGIRSTLSNVTCPILLQATKKDNNAVDLTWSAFVGFQEGISGYTVEVLDENNQVVNSYSATGNAYTDQSPNETLPVLRYRIMVTSRNGATSYSNIVPIEQTLHLYIPSAFTPNGDGLNDLFEVKGKMFRDFNVKVYNRTGQVVYTSTDASSGWDGTYSGRLQPAGAYVYEVKVTAPDGSSKTRTGSVMLLR